MADLKGTKTVDNLKAGFAGESQANRRYLYFAEKADTEGAEEVAAYSVALQMGKLNMLLDTSIIYVIMVKGILQQVFQ